MYPKRSAARPGTHAALVAILVVAAGCSAARPTGGAAAGDGPTAATRDDAGDLLSAADRARLERITAERSNGGTGEGYHIGPDDLLEIRIPDLLEVTTVAGGARAPGAMPVVSQAPVAAQGVRVSADGEITVPTIGAMQAAGLTTSALEQEIAKRLVDAGILRRPQVSVQITEYRSRVVAVVGSVERPGLYPVTRPAATLADLIWAAGGPNRDAGRMVEFVPASADGAPRNARPPVNLASATTHGNPVRLDLQSLLQATGTDAQLLNPPVRPGDVISLAPAGNVQVDGWVQKPGSYQLTRGLTLMGAVAAAGGRLFPANSRAVTVKRTLGSGEQRVLAVDAQAVSEGTAPDLPMIDGDVVQVPASYTRLAPWALWTAVRELVHVGGNALLF
jgi:polysaccharide export outer membrane protein